MNRRSVTAPTGAIISLGLAGVVFAPALLLSTADVGVADYYAAGPIGLSIVGVIALFDVIVFLSGREGRTDQITVAGLVLVSAAAMTIFSLLWATTITPTLISGFTADNAWIAFHRWIVSAGAFAIFVSAALYTQSVLSL